MIQIVFTVKCSSVHPVLFGFGFFFFNIKLKNAFNYLNCIVLVLLWKIHSLLAAYLSQILRVVPDGRASVQLTIYTEG